MQFSNAGPWPRHNEQQQYNANYDGFCFSMLFLVAGDICVDEQGDSINEVPRQIEYVRVYDIDSTRPCPPSKTQASRPVLCLLIVWLYLRLWPVQGNKHFGNQDWTSALLCYGAHVMNTPSSGDGSWTSFIK